MLKQSETHALYCCRFAALSRCPSDVAFNWSLGIIASHFPVSASKSSANMNNNIIGGELNSTVAESLHEGLMPVLFINQN
eukprot:864388-Prorocentrum_minimum.AAC.1